MFKENEPIEENAEYLSVCSGIHANQSVATLFAIYASLFTNCVLIVNRQEKYCLNATVISAIVNVGLNFILMPWLGMIGAAITTVLAEFVNCVMQIHFSKPFFNWRTLGIKPIMSCVCGSAAIGVICMISVQENIGNSGDIEAQREIAVFFLKAYSLK